MSLAHHAHTRRHKHCCYSYSCNDRVSLITHQDGFDSVLCASDQCRGTVPAVTRFCVICSCSWVAGGTPPELQCHTLSSLSPHLLSPSFIPPFFFFFHLATTLSGAALGLSCITTLTLLVISIYQASRSCCKAQRKGPQWEFWGQTWAWGFQVLK